MALGNQKKMSTLKMVQLAILTAIIFIMTFTPLGYLKILVVDITFLMIPVAIGAVITGPLGGLFLGTVFGISSFLTCFGYSAFGTFLFGVNPFFTFIMCIIPRALMGFLVGVVFNALKKIDKTNTVSYFVASACGAIFNTILFVIFLVVLFGNSQAVLDVFGATSIWGIIAGLITFNAAIETACSLIIGGAISKSLSIYLPRLYKQS